MPIHFQDAKGEWQKIDNKLVPTDEPGYAVKNSANNASIKLPKDPAKTPAKVQRDGRYVEFSLKGAQKPAGQG